MSWSFLPILLLITSYCYGNLEYRLPTSLSPEQYDINIDTFLDEPDNAFTFTGHVKIMIKCLDPTENITLHSKDLEIISKETVVKDVKTKHKITVANQTEDCDKEFYIIHLGSTLKMNHLYEVSMNFKGKLIDGLAGYYRSSYIDNKTNKTHWLAVTQFEPTDARRAFPCFDEPSFKAKFKIGLGHNKNLTALSNMPLEIAEDIEDKEGWVLDKFELSVPMSTYLVAFVISDLKHKMSPAFKDSGVNFKIWARNDALSQVEFAKEVGPKALNFYEEYFNIKYPLPKQDMLAIPDFSAGAMENWGLITYRETYLLHDPEVSSITSKHRIASVIAHELAHQWFGNLVTMKWWTDLWLNEGFATYMAGLAVHNLYPMWNSLNEEVVGNLLQVYSLDSLKSSHPISIDIKNPTEIRQIFDVISYKKGSFLLRMMSLFLGDSVLRTGVSNYLKDNEFMNAEQDDLWKSLTVEAHKENVLSENLTVKTIMDTWTLQTGYPVVTVTRDYALGKANISQERFLNENADLRKSLDPCWWVPVSYTTEDEVDFNATKPKLWLSCPKEIQTIDTPKSRDWIIVNVQASGLYKVNYDKRNWDMIIKTLKSHDYKMIPVINRVLLIDNSLQLANSGYLNYEVTFELLSYLQNEEEYLPWSAALSRINYVKNMLKRSSAYGVFKKYMKKLLTPIFDRVGGILVRKENHDHLDTVNFQNLIAKAACTYEVSSCQQHSSEQFKRWKNNPDEPNPISQDIRSVVYCAAISKGGEDEWNFLWNQYKISNVGTEKSIILQALACTKEIWLLKRYLDWSIHSDSGIRKQDAINVFQSVTHNDVGYYIAKNYFENGIQSIYKNILPSEQHISSYISSLATYMMTEHEEKEFTKFTHDNKKYLKKSQLGVQQALETIDINVKWQQKYMKDVEHILTTKLSE